MARMFSSDALLCVAGIALGIGLLSEQPAHAGNTLGCAFTDKYGTIVGYSFVKGSDNSVHEFKVIRQVAHANPYILAEHSYPDLPGWAAGWDNKTFWLTPDANPEYQIRSWKLGKPDAKGTRSAGASLFKNNTKISDGGCMTTGGKAWERDAGSPVYPVVARTPSVPQETMPTFTSTAPTPSPAPSSDDTSIPDPGKLLQ